MKPSTLRLTTLVLSLAASGLASAETYCGSLSGR